MADEVIAVAGKVTLDTSQVKEGGTQATNALRGLKDSGSEVKSSMSSMRDGLAMTGLALKGVREIAGTVGETFKAVFEFGFEGAQIKQLHESFATLIGTGGQAAKMERDIADATHGAVDGEEAQSAILKLLAGATGVFSDKAKEAVPTLFQMAAASAKLNPTMGSTIDVMNAMAASLETGNLKGLKRYGILVDAKASEEKYAASIGKTREELDEEEVKVAHLNATLEYLPKLMEQVGGSTESATDVFNQFEVAVDDLSDAAKEMAAGPIGEVLKVLTQMILFDKQLDSSKIVAQSNSYRDYIERMYAAGVASGKLDAVQAKQLLDAKEGSMEWDSALAAVAKRLGIVTEAEYEVGKEWERLNPILADTGDKYGKVSASMETTSGIMAKQAAEAKKLADAQAKVADAWFGAVTRIKGDNDRYLADRAELVAKGDAESTAKIAQLDAQMAKERDAQAAAMIKPEMFSSVEAYTEAKRKLLLATGQATKASFAEQDAQSILAIAYGAGRITAEQYALGIKKIPEAAKDGVVGIGELVKSLSGTKFSLKNLDDSAAEVKTRAYSTYLDAGREVARGAAQGVQSNQSIYMDSLNNMADAGINAFKLKNRIESPSLVFAGLGNDLMAGLAMGITEGSAPVQEALAGLIINTLSPFQTMLEAVSLSESNVTAAMAIMATTSRDILRKELETLNNVMGGAGGTLADFDELKGIAAGSMGTIAAPLEASLAIVRNMAAEAGSAAGGLAGALQDIKNIGNITNTITTIHIDIYRTRDEGAPTAPGESQGTPTSGPGHSGGGGEQEGFALGGFTGRGGYARVHPNEYMLSEAMRSGKQAIAPGALAPAAIAQLGGGSSKVTIYGGLALYGVQDAPSLLEQLRELR